MNHVIANDLPFQSEERDPFKALRATLATSSNDWGSARDFAWIWGIVCGWSDEDGDAYPALAAKFGWSEAQVQRLKELHAAFEAAAKEAP
jgi:hypothetical protein